MTGLALVIGCGLDTSGVLSSEPDASTSEDAPVTPDVANPTCAWRPRFFDACALPAAGPAVVLAGNSVTYDTDVPGFVEEPPADPPSITIDQGGTPAVVISVERFTVPTGTRLRVIGSKPLVIASWSAIDVTGTIDVGSHRGEAKTGAGANPKLCEATAAGLGDDETTTGGGSGGGGGGSFAGIGGKGGPGDSGGENPGGDGGALVGVPTIVRGGCPGAASGVAGPDGNVGQGSTPTTRAAGGAGGGAIQLSAKESISIGATARVLAGGAGGSGAPRGSAVGGGGGGSGGFIGFDAPMLAFAAGAKIAANGGGGGSSDAFAASGDPGGDGGEDATPAPGGIAGQCATAGAPGAAGATINGPASSQNEVSCGGGGGGGSVGYILVFVAGFTPPNGVVFSPAATVVP